MNIKLWLGHIIDQLHKQGDTNFTRSPNLYGCSCCCIQQLTNDWVGQIKSESFPFSLRLKLKYSVWYPYMYKHINKHKY